MQMEISLLFLTLLSFACNSLENQIKFAEYTFTCKFDLLDEIKRFYLNAIRPNNMKRYCESASSVGFEICNT